MKSRELTDTEAIVALLSSSLPLHPQLDVPTDRAVQQHTRVRPCMIWSERVYPHRAVHEVSEARIVEALDEGGASEEPLNDGEGFPRGRAVQLQELPLQRRDHLRWEVNNVPRDLGERGGGVRLQ